jgi:hypothetical protein
MAIWWNKKMGTLTASGPCTTHVGVADAGGAKVEVNGSGIVEVAVGPRVSLGEMGIAVLVEVGSAGAGPLQPASSKAARMTILHEFIWILVEWNGRRILPPNGVSCSALRAEPSD